MYHVCLQQFRDSDAADKAIANLNGLELAGRAIKVGNITTGADNVMTIDSLDGEDSDVGVGMTPQSRMALMAKLAAGHNTGEHDIVDSLNWNLVNGNSRLLVTIPCSGKFS